ncbi:MAG: hypothetical protein ACRDU0_16780, partial [Mycobacterium sp.]
SGLREPSPADFAVSAAGCDGDYASRAPVRHDGRGREPTTTIGDGGISQKQTSRQNEEQK